MCKKLHTSNIELQTYTTLADVQIGNAFTSTKLADRAGSKNTTRRTLHTAGSAQGSIGWPDRGYFGTDSAVAARFGHHSSGEPPPQNKGWRVSSKV